MAQKYSFMFDYLCGGILYALYVVLFLPVVAVGLCMIQDY